MLPSVVIYLLSNVSLSYFQVDYYEHDATHLSNDNPSQGMHSARSAFN